MFRINTKSRATWRRGFRAFLVAALASSGLSILAAQADAQDKIDKALESIRGIDLSKLSDSEMEALNKRLDETWKIILDNPKQAKPKVRATLSQEHEDSFRIIDLAHLLVVLDSQFMA